MKHCFSLVSTKAENLFLFFIICILLSFLLQLFFSSFSFLLEVILWSNLLAEENESLKRNKKLIVVVVVVVVVTSRQWCSNLDVSLRSFYLLLSDCCVRQILAKINIFSRCQKNLEENVCIDWDWNFFLQAMK